MRKLLSLLNGGNAPRNVVPAAILGLLAGLACGWNFAFLTLFLVAALFNFRATTWLTLCAVGCAISMLFAGPLAWLGRVALDQGPLGTLVAGLGDGPLVAWFDLDRYDLIGDLLVGAVLAIPVGRIAARRAKVAGADADAKNPVLRPLGAPIFVCGLWLASWIPGSVGARAIEQGLLAELSQFAQAEVTADEFHLDPWSGRLDIENLHVPDATNLDRDLVVARRATARLRPGALLRGRLEIVELRIEDLRSDVPRAKPAAPLLLHPWWSRPRLSEEEPAPSVTGVELADCLNDSLGSARKIQGLRRAVALVDALERLEQDLSDDSPDSSPARGAWRAAQRSSLGVSRPLVSIESSVISDFAPEWGLGQGAQLEIQDLRSRRGGVDSSAKLRLLAPERSAELTLLCHAGDGDRPHRLELVVGNVPLERLLSGSVLSQRMNLDAGVAAITASGWLSLSDMQLQTRLEARDLKVEVLGSERLAGLSPRLWTEGLAHLGKIRVDAEIRGPWNQPVVRLDEELTVANFEYALRGSGSHDLAQRVEIESHGGGELAWNSGAGAVAISDDVEPSLAEVSSSTGPSTYPDTAAPEQELWLGEEEPPISDVAHAAQPKVDANAESSPPREAMTRDSAAPPLGPPPPIDRVASDDTASDKVTGDTAASDREPTKEPTEKPSGAAGRPATHGLPGGSTAARPTTIATKSPDQPARARGPAANVAGPSKRATARGTSKRTRVSPQNLPQGIDLVMGYDESRDRQPTESAPETGNAHGETAPKVRPSRSAIAGQSGTPRSPNRTSAPLRGTARPAAVATRRGQPLPNAVTPTRAGQVWRTNAPPAEAESPRAVAVASEPSEPGHDASDETNAAPEESSKLARWSKSWTKKVGSIFKSSKSSPEAELESNGDPFLRQARKEADEREVQDERAWR